MEENDEKKFELKNIKTLIKKIIILIIIGVVLVFITVGGVYVMKRETFKTSAEAVGTYKGNSKLDPEEGIIIQPEDGETIEEIFDKLYGADDYLKDDEESTKYEKLQYLINAELVTTNPYISSIKDDESKLNGIIKFYRYANKEEVEDANKFSQEHDENEKTQEKYQMIYTSEEELEKMIKECESSGSKEVLKYFTINEDGAVVIATWTSITTTVTTNDSEVIAETTSDDTVSKKELIELKKLVGNYSMPFNLLWAFLVQTGSYEFVEEIAELGYESEISIGIFDNENTSVQTNVERYSKKIKYTENTKLDLIAASATTSINTEGAVVSCFGTLQDSSATHSNNLGYSEPGTLYEHYIIDTTPAGVITNISGQEKRYETTTTTTFSGSSNPTIGVLYVDNWAAKWTATYKPEEPEDTEPQRAAVGGYSKEYESVPRSKFASSLIYGDGIMGRILTRHSERIKRQAIQKFVQNADLTAAQRIKEKEKLDKDITYEQWPTAIKAKVDIEAEALLTKNINNYTIDKTDCYDEAIRFKEIINKKKHDDVKELLFIKRTDWFWEYIRAAEDTKDLEDLIKATFYIASDKTYKDFNEEQIDEIFNAFEPKDSNSFTITYGGTIAEKIWFSLRDAGYSEYAAAGAMGNLHCESGLLTNNLEDIFEMGRESDFVLIGKYQTGYTDETYTQAVDTGIITREQFISDHELENCGAGYGLAQWTWHTRKAALYDLARSKGVSIADEDMQIELLINELPNYEYDDWVNAESPEDAAIAFCHHFENPNITDTKYREERAREYYEQFHGGKLEGESDSSGSTASGSNYWAERILEEAQKLHDKQRAAGWGYSNDPKFLRSPVDKQLENPWKMSNCSTFVGSVLYLAGLYPEAENVYYNFHSQYSQQAKFEAEGWERIDNVQDFEPGDIVQMSDQRRYDKITHVNIYAGDDTWYDGGHVYTPMPMKRDRASYVATCGKYIWAYRPPRMDT